MHNMVEKVSMIDQVPHYPNLEHIYKYRMSLMDCV